MPTKVNAKIVGKDFFFGVKWDSYTPQVEAQLTKDLIAMSTQARGLNFVMVCDSNEADRLLISMRVKRITASTFATMWIMYRTQEESHIEIPEHAVTILERDMSMDVAAPVIDPGTHSGYALTPQGRVAPDRIGINRPAPNSSAKPDYALIMLWS
jgi:hypothetical protein